MPGKGQQLRLQVSGNESHRLARIDLNRDRDGTSSHGAERIAVVIDLDRPEVWCKLNDVFALDDRTPGEPRDSNGMGLLLRVLRDPVMPIAVQPLDEVVEGGWVADLLERQCVRILGIDHSRKALEFRVVYDCIRVRRETGRD